MHTLRLDARDPVAIVRAAEIIKAGGLVAFPTETVYGLGANALDASAVRKIFAAKERPAWDPVIVHLASPEMLSRVAAPLPQRATGVAKRFMPGPLTLLLPRVASLPKEITAGRELVGVRIPDHPVARKLIERADLPIAAPSANRFGHVSPTTAAHVLADLDGRIDAVLDGGPTRVGVESTVLDVSTIPPTILRQGGVSREQLEQILGSIQVYRASTSDAPPESLPSPGVGIRHYAPRARLVLVSGDETWLRSESEKQAGAVGVLLPSGWRASGLMFDWGAWGDWEQLAARLYAGLRWLDERNVSVIVAPLPPDEGLGRTIRDRLEKAAMKS